MLYKNLSLLFSLILSISFCSNVSRADIVYTTYTDTITSTTIPELSVGDSIVFTYFLDNGGSSTLNQTWEKEDFVFFSMNVNDGALIVTGTAIDIGEGSGSFVTNGAGELTEVGRWGHQDPANIFDSLGYSPGFWKTMTNPVYTSSGGNIDLFEDGDGFVSSIDAALWSNPVVVPEPSTYALLAITVFVGWISYRRKAKPAC